MAQYLLDGVKELPFCDTEFEVDGLKQIWGGEYQVDEHHCIVIISREWLGTGDNRITYKVPSPREPLDTLEKRAARALANVLEKEDRFEIEDAVNDYLVSRLEREWQPEAAE